MQHWIEILQKYSKSSLLKSVMSPKSLHTSTSYTLSLEKKGFCIILGGKYSITFILSYSVVYDLTHDDKMCLTRNLGKNKALCGKKLNGFHGALMMSFHSSLGLPDVHICIVFCKQIITVWIKKWEKKSSQTDSTPLHQPWLWVVLCWVILCLQWLTDWC